MQSLIFEFSGVREMELIDRLRDREEIELRQELVW
jgi:hypothetical protein